MVCIVFTLFLYALCVLCFAKLVSNSIRFLFSKKGDYIIPGVVLILEAHILIHDTYLYAMTISILIIMLDDKVISFLRLFSSEYVIIIGISNDYWNRTELIR